jgi:hypothetical protein
MNIENDIALFSGRILWVRFSYFFGCTANKRQTQGWPPMNADERRLKNKMLDPPIDQCPGWRRMEAGVGPLCCGLPGIYAAFRGRD